MQPDFDIIRISHNLLSKLRDRSMGSVGPMVHFQHSEVPERNRRGGLHKVRDASLNIEFEPLSDKVELGAQVMVWPGAAVMRGHSSPGIARRLDLSRQTDAFELVWNAVPGIGEAKHLGRVADAREHVAFLASNSDQYLTVMHSDCKPVNVRIDRRKLLTLVPHAESRLMEPIAADCPPLILLRSYLDVLRQSAIPASPELDTLVAEHICDLVALAIGAGGEARTLADGRGGRAARLAAVKRWIMDQIGDPGLTISKAAAAQGLSTRYIQLLFEETGRTFSEFVRSERLSLARRSLASPLQSHRSIADIAFGAGFGDLSHFNRSFKIAYGSTPTDLRQRPDDV